MTGPRPDRRPSLDEIFGQRPSLDEIFGASRPPGVLETAGAGLRGMLSAINTVVAGTGRKLARIPTGGRENPVSSYFRDVEEGGRALARPRDPRLRPAFEASETIGRVGGEVAKYVGAGMTGGILAPALLGTGEAVGSAPEESEAALGGTVARMAGSPRLAAAFDRASQTPHGRALVSAVMSVVPDVAIHGAGKLRALRAPVVTPTPTPARPRLLLPASTGRTLDAPLNELPAGAAPIAPPNPRAPVTDPRRLLPATTAPVPPAVQARREVEAAIEARRNAVPTITRRPRAEAEARKVAQMAEPFEQAPPAIATPDEVQAYLANQRIGEKGAAIRRRKPNRALDALVAAERAENAAREAVPVGAPLDDRYWQALSRDPEIAATAMDGGTRVQTQAAGDVSASLPRNLETLSDEELEAAWVRLAEAEAMDTDLHVLPDGLAELVGEQGATNFSKARMKARMAKERAMGLRASEVRAEGLDMTEDMRGAIEAAGFDPSEFVALRDAQRKAQVLSVRRQRTMQRLDAERARRGLRSGRASVEAVSALAGGGTGFVGGLAMDDEPGGMTPLQRALAGAAVGVGAGYGAARAVARAKGPFVQTTALMNDPDPLLRKAGAAINVGARATRDDPAFLSRAEQLLARWVSESSPLVKAARVGGGSAAETRMADAIAQQHGHGQAAKQYIQDVMAPAIRGFDDATMQRLSTLLVYQRDLDIRAKGGAAKTALSDDEVAATVATLRADTRVAQAAQRLQDMAVDLLEKRLDAGLITPEQFAAIRASEDYYTPFLREMVNDPSVTLPATKGGMFSVKGSGVKRMDRTQEVIEQLADPVEVLTKAALNTFRDVSKQRVNNVLLELADAGALPFVRQVPNSTGASAAPGTFQTMRQGMLLTYRVDDKDLLRVLADLPPRADGPVMRFAKGLKAVKTAGVTLLPDFSVANVIRDVALSGIQRPDFWARGVREGATGAALGGVAGVVGTDRPEDAVKNFLTGAGLGAGAGVYARPLIETLGAMRSIVQNDAAYQQFLRDGSATEGFFVRTPTDAKRVLDHIRTSGAFDPKTIVSPRSWMDALRFIGSVGEQSTRLAAYNQVKGMGGSAGEAARAAQDRTLRFANVGSSSKTLAALTPFWNAKVQGWDKLVRLLGGANRKQTAAAGAMMLTAPTLALWSVNKDNPAYWERPTWEKNLFWLVPKGDGEFWRVPKPFEIGFLFASLPERMLDYAAQTGADLPGFGPVASAAPEVAEPGRLLGRAAADMAGATFEGTVPIPEVASIPMQVLLDKDLFRNRRIVSNPRVSPELQTTPESSALARALSKVGVSPEQTDFAVRSAFGTAGSEASKLVDAGARALGVPASTGDGRPPFLGRFATRFVTGAEGQTDIEAAARERIRRVQQVESDYAEMEKRGASDTELDTFVRTHADDLAVLDDLKAVQKALDQFTRDRNAIRRDPSITPEERRELLRQIRTESAEYARLALAAKAPPP